MAGRPPRIVFRVPYHHVRQTKLIALSCAYGLCRQDIGSDTCETVLPTASELQRTISTDVRLDPLQQTECHRAIYASVNF
jgi:hypothetical protein